MSWWFEIQRTKNNGVCIIRIVIFETEFIFSFSIRNERDELRKQHKVLKDELEKIRNTLSTQCTNNKVINIYLYIIISNYVF